jgi:diketogulonate reductase-like aldo/keto reductase
MSSCSYGQSSRTSSPSQFVLFLHFFLISIAQEDLHKYCLEHNIVLEAYSSLGKGRLLSNSKIIEMAKKYQVTPSQLLLRYGLERNIVVIPKSSSPKRIQENADLYHFRISPEDMNVLNGMNQNWHCTWDPTHAL